MKEGSYWFKRLVKECKQMDPELKFVRIRLGFYRIYWRGAYLHECYKDMNHRGYEIDDIDPRLESLIHYQEFEDQVDLTRKLKNYVEGFFDARKTIRTRLYMMRHNEDFYKEARGAYQEFIVK